MRFFAHDGRPRRLTAAAVAGGLVALGLTAVPATAAGADNRAYVANGGAGTVSVLDATTHLVVATISVGTQPHGVAVNPDRTRVYVVNEVNGTVSVIDTATEVVTATIAVGMFPRGVAVNPAGTRVYVADEASQTVSVIDTATNTVAATIPVGTSPAGWRSIRRAPAPTSPTSVMAPSR